MIEEYNKEEPNISWSIKDMLKIIMSSSMVLSFKIAVSHWNITWPYFLSIHPILWDIYSEIFNSDKFGIDVYWERIRQLDWNTIKWLREALQYSIIKEETKYRKDTDALSEVISDIVSMEWLLYKAKEMCGEDLDTQQILIDACMQYAQWKFLLSSNK